MNKELIQTRFSKSLTSYNENAIIQKKMAEKLLSFLSRKSCSKVLELGCGTGFLTKLLNEKIEFESYTAIDIVGECSKYISEINPEIEFINADIESYILENSSKYDLIISNAALQWISEFESVVNNLESKLVENGELLISTFGKENFKEIYQTTKIALDYYSDSELQEFFPNSQISSEKHVLEFDSPKDVLKHLKLTGVNAIQSKNWTKTDLANFETQYNNICGAKTLLTYNPVYIKISK